MRSRSRSRICSSTSCKLVARNKGFALLELIVVVGLLGVMMFAFLSWQARSQARQARDQAMSEMVSDLRLLTRATQQFVRDNVSTWTEGSATSITIAQLQTAGLLPTDFANRVYGAGTTPFGAPFRIVSIRNTGQPGARTLIGDRPSDNMAAFDRFGLENSDIQAVALKRELAGMLVSEGYAAGSTEGGSTTATGGGGNAWTKDIAAWISPPGRWPTVQVFLGFPDLDGSMPGGGNPGDDDEEPIVYQDCQVVKPTCTVFTVGNPGCSSANVVEAVCPAGKVEAGSFPKCGYRETVFSSTDVGSVTMGSYTEPPVRSWEDPNGDFDCCSHQCARAGEAGSGTPATNGSFAERTNSYQWGIATLNNVEVTRDLCRVTYTRSSQCGNTGPAAVQTGNVNWPTNTRILVCCTVAE